MAPLSEHLLFETLPIGLAVCDMEGKLTYVNQAYAEIIGYTTQEVLELTYWEITPKDFERQEQEQLDCLEKTGRYGPYEKEYLHKDGRRVPVRLSGVILNENDEKFIWSSVEDITERKRSEENLRKMSSALEQSPSAIFITDLDGTIEYVNPKFSELTGFAAEEAVGQNPRILKSLDTPKELYEHLWQTILAGKEWKGELRDRRKNGSHFWAYQTITPIKDTNGSVTHYVATHQDISERKDAEHAIQSALEHADIANRAKSELLANMSHELRTPLNAIIGFSRVIKEEVFGPVGHEKYQEYNEDISASGQHLLELIDDILDVSAIEAGMMELNLGELDVGRVVEDSLRLVRHRADQGKVQITKDIEEGLPSLFADSRRIKQVLLNLMSNAIKFTRPDGVVSLSVSFEEEKGHVFTVSDTGIGMTQKELAKAMQQFGQVDRGSEGKHEGTGLGLPLTKGLVDLHNGTMVIESEKGVGTTVTVKFPQERGVKEE